MAHSNPFRYLDQNNRIPRSVVEYCINCPALDDQAIVTSPENVADIRKRVEQCRESGRYQGDFCARFFIFDPGIDTIDATEDAASE